MLEPEAFSSYLGGRLSLLTLKSMVMTSNSAFIELFFINGFFTSNV